jgi:hypothetical protein
MRTINIWLDDRVMEPFGCFRVTTAENCIEMLKRVEGQVHTLSLDHDLGLNDHGHERMNGYKVAEFLEEAAHDGKWELVPTRIECHSGNAVGISKIRAAVQNMQKWREEQGL